MVDDLCEKITSIVRALYTKHHYIADPIIARDTFLLLHLEYGATQASLRGHAVSHRLKMILEQIVGARGGRSPICIFL